MESKGDVTQW